MVVQYIEVAGEPFAILPKKDFEYLSEMAENADDIATLQRIMDAYDPREESFPAEFVNTLCDATNAGKPLIPIWRDYRGLTQAKLAKDVGVSQAYISDIESGKKEGSVGVLKKIAECLKCDLDDLV